MAEKVRFGIISTAHINRLVIPGAHASDKVDLIAVASRDQARAEEYARKWEIERAYGSYEALLEDPDVDAVYISLPNTMHAEWSIKSVEAGKHVLVEKPFSRHPEDVERSLRRGGEGRPAPERGVHVPAQPAGRARRSRSCARARSASSASSGRSSATRCTTPTTSACAPTSRAAA